MWSSEVKEKFDAFKFLASRLNSGLKLFRYVIEHLFWRFLPLYWRPSNPGYEFSNVCFGLQAESFHHKR